MLAFEKGRRGECFVLTERRRQELTKKVLVAELHKFISSPRVIILDKARRKE